MISSPQFSAPAPSMGGAPAPQRNWSAIAQRHEAEHQSTTGEAHPFHANERSSLTPHMKGAFTPLARSTAWQHHGDTPLPGSKHTIGSLLMSGLGEQE